MTKPNRSKKYRLFFGKKTLKISNGRKTMIKYAILNMGISDFLSQLFFDSAIENQLKHELSTLIIRLDLQEEI